MGLFTPDEIVYNFGKLVGNVIQIDNVNYTISYVKLEKMSRQLSVETTSGDIIPLNQDEFYEFPNLTYTPFKVPTKPKPKKRKKQ
jgi:hypothetical protein